MQKYSVDDPIDIEKREALLRAVAVFATLTPDEIHELATLMYEVFYFPGDVIVTEDTLIDSVFIITEGHAEISHLQTIKTKLTKREKTKKVPFAVIHTGDAIGLNDTGFFSESGKRMATVIAVDEVKALKLELKVLHDFLRAHAHLQSAMYESAEQMLRVRLIKQSLPFSRLSYERLRWLASQVEEMSVPAGTIIFKQGDIGDRCYLIQSGQVEIVTTNEDGSERLLASLKTPTLFGEATLMTRTPRNATARAVNDCKLFVLRHEYLSELIETEGNVAKMVMTLMVDRSRPLQNSHVIAHPRTTADEQEIFILKNPDNGNYFKLSAEGWFIWEQLNGKQTMQDVTLALAEKFNIFAPDVVAGLISKLAKAGFITNVDVSEDGKLSDKPLWVRVMLKVRKLLEARVAIGDANVWLTSLYNKVGYLLFTRLGLVIMTVIALAGFTAFGFATENVLNIFKTIPNSWVLLIFLVPFTLLSVALHELGHALTTKSFGYEVHYMGVGWYWLSPVAFTDTSDMWLSTRWPRTMVNLAGICTDILVAGIASLLIFALPNPYVQGFLWVFAIYTYINAFRMLSPLQELDGYYVLMDMLEKPRLRQSAVLWLVKVFPKSFRQPSLFRDHVPEMIYWLACILFLVLMCLLTLFVQAFIFKVLGFKPENHFVSLAIPLLVVLISSLGIIADIRSQSED